MNDSDTHVAREMSVPPGMVEVSAGWFLMGVRNDEKWMDAETREDLLDDAHPQRRIWLSTYCIDIFPVTNRQYREFVESTDYLPPLAPKFYRDTDAARFAWDLETNRYPVGLDDYPVVLVSWYDAVAYCEWMGKRLPTEAEWEKAARGADGRPFPWGSARNFAQRLHHRPIRNGDLPPQEQLAPVHQYPQGGSPYGCHAMLGNVGEWCADYYDEGYYERMPERDPSGPDAPRVERFRRVEAPALNSRVVRGYAPGYRRVPHVATRGGMSPWFRGHLTGFR